MRVMNSSRVRWLDRKTPVKADVVVADCCFSMPRICMHMWLAVVNGADVVDGDLFDFCFVFCH